VLKATVSSSMTSVLSESVRARWGQGAGVEGRGWGGGFGRAPGARGTGWPPTTGTPRSSHQSVAWPGGEGSLFRFLFVAIGIYVLDFPRRVVFKAPAKQTVSQRRVRRDHHRAMPRVRQCGIVGAVIRRRGLLRHQTSGIAHLRRTPHHPTDRVFPFRRRGTERSSGSPPLSLSRKNTRKPSLLIC